MAHRLKFIIVTILCFIILLILGNHTTLAINKELFIKSVGYEENIENMNKEIIKTIKQQFPKYDDSKSLKTEIVVPVEIGLDLSTIGTNSEGKKIYTIIIGNYNPENGNNKKTVTAKELNQDYAAGLKTDQNGDLDLEYAWQHNGWTAYVKLKCDAKVEENLYNVLYTVTAVEISSKPEDLKITPKEISDVIKEQVEQIEQKKEQEKKDKEAEEEGKKTLNEMKNDFGRDPLRYTRKMVLENNENGF